MDPAKPGETRQQFRIRTVRSGGFTLRFNPPYDQTSDIRHGMAASQRNKGHRGEREFARLLSAALGQPVARNLAQVRDGGADILDVDGWAVEVKRHEKPSPGAWWKTLCERRFSEPRHPALAWRRNRQPWQVMVPLGCLVEGAPEAETAILSLTGFAALVKEPYRFR